MNRIFCITVALLALLVCEWAEGETGDVLWVRPLWVGNPVKPLQIRISTEGETRQWPLSCWRPGLPIQLSTAAKLGVIGNDIEQWCGVSELFSGSAGGRQQYLFLWSEEGALRALVTPLTGTGKVGFLNLTTDACRIKLASWSGDCAPGQLVRGPAPVVESSDAVLAVAARRGERWRPVFSNELRLRSAKSVLVVIGPHVSGSGRLPVRLVYP